MKDKKKFRKSKEKDGWGYFKTNKLVIQIREENKRTGYHIIYAILICGIFTLVSLAFLLPILAENHLFMLAMIIHTSVWIGCFFYISIVILKKSPHIKGFIIATMVIVIGVIIADAFAQAFGLYEDANYFFEWRIDILSHFLAGTIFFLILIMILSLFKTKYHISSIALITTNLLLFFYEIWEEIIDIFYGELSANWEHSFSNPFFWNSIQDIIMNFIGSFTTYLISRKYIRNRIQPELIETKF
jgi:hypothetical protein